MNNKQTGTKYEEQAARFLAEHGFKLLEQNFRSRQGEVDLIGIHENCLVFVEVKYRKTAAIGLPEEAVGRDKQIRICKVSDYYRLIHPKESGRQIRYDVVAICGKDVFWHRNAFPYCREKNRRYSW